MLCKLCLLFISYLFIQGSSLPWYNFLLKSESVLSCYYTTLTTNNNNKKEEAKTSEICCTAYCTPVSFFTEVWIVYYSKISIIFLMEGWSSTFFVVCQKMHLRKIAGNFCCKLSVFMFLFFNKKNSVRDHHFNLSFVYIKVDFAME